MSHSYRKICLADFLKNEHVLQMQFSAPLQESSDIAHNVI